MIATILPSSPTFHAIAYNELKVTQGFASLLEMKNFGPINTFGYSSPDELTRFLIEYSSQNSRIKQPQFHLAISCKGHEYTEEQLIEFAHNYLAEMGYGDPNQPLLIYGHRDTENTHIHIITSRVDPKGKKIDDSNERRRSQKVLDKLLKTDLKATAEKDLQTALQFDFRNINQFKAVMEAMNYECYDKDEIMYIKKGGCIQTKIETSKVEEMANQRKRAYQQDVAEQARWKAIFKKYRDTNSSRTGLERDLKKMFGISLVFFGKKDSPYGYVAIDFNKKKVYEGGRILGIKNLLDFRSPEEHMDEIEEFIINAIEQNSRITTRGLNKKLRQMGAFVRKDAIIFGDMRKAMADGHRAILDRNNKIEWRNNFRTQTKEERDLLCKLTGFEYPELISIYPASNGKYYCKDYHELSEILAINNPKIREEAFKTAGFRIVVDNSKAYAYRPETQSLTDLSKAGFERSQYSTLIPYSTSRNNVESNKAPEIKESNKKKNHTVASRPNNDGSRYSNREWEVGKKDKDQDDLEQNGGMSY